MDDQALTANAGQPETESCLAWGTDQPEEPIPFRQTRKGILITVTVASIAFAGIGLAAALVYRPVTVRTVSTTTTIPAATPDQVFMKELHKHGILDAGVEATKHRFMEYAHHGCFNLLPPRPQTWDEVVATIVARENADVALHENPDQPPFTAADGDALLRAAVMVYCPQVQP